MQTRRARHCGCLWPMTVCHLTQMDAIQIIHITPAYRSWINQTLRQRWGSSRIVSRGQVYAGDQLPGFIALHQGQPSGLVTYNLETHQCEIVSLDSLAPGIGIGSSLIEAVKEVAQQARCQRLWLITTNDNLPAIGFYQKRGFHLVAVHPDAVLISRTLKPSIPETGLEGIPIRDELEFEIILTAGG